MKTDDIEKLKLLANGDNYHFLKVLLFKMLKEELSHHDMSPATEGAYFRYWRAGGVAGGIDGVSSRCNKCQYSIDIECDHNNMSNITVNHVNLKTIGFCKDTK